MGLGRSARGAGQRITARAFDKALVICGLLHGLSLAFRLGSAGIAVEKSYTYIPYRRLGQSAKF